MLRIRQFILIVIMHFPYVSYQGNSFSSTSLPAKIRFSRRVEFFESTGKSKARNPFSKNKMIKVVSLSTIFSEDETCTKIFSKAINDHNEKTCFLFDFILRFFHSLYFILDTMSVTVCVCDCETLIRDFWLCLSSKKYSQVKLCKNRGSLTDVIFSGPWKKLRRLWRRASSCLSIIISEIHI